MSFQNPSEGPTTFLRLFPAFRTLTLHKFTPEKGPTQSKLQGVVLQNVKTHNDNLGLQKPLFF